jgi:Arc/MetJ-type ribon-helix-helix transcriptional regulator
MADSERESWSIPVSAEFAAELRAAMASEGFESKSEFVRAALREKLERSARRRLETALLESVERGDYDEAGPELWGHLRDLANGKKNEGA